MPSSNKGFRKRFSDALKKGMTTDAALQAALPNTPPTPPMPKSGVTMDARKFRATVRDALKAGKTVDEAIKLGTISGSARNDPVPHSEAMTKDRVQLFKDSLRASLKAGKSTRDAINEATGAMQVTTPKSPPEIKSAGVNTGAGDPNKTAWGVMR